MLIHQKLCNFKQCQCHWTESLWLIRSWNISCHLSRKLHYEWWVWLGHSKLRKLQFWQRGLCGIKGMLRIGLSTERNESLWNVWQGTFVLVWFMLEQATLKTKTSQVLLLKCQTCSNLSLMICTLGKLGLDNTWRTRNTSAKTW